MNRTRTIFAALSIAFLAGCTSVGPSSAPKSLALGDSPIRHVSYSKASGSACGIEVLDLIPIGVWGRSQRAYHSAITQAGARALLSPTVSDSRLDLMVATIKCSSVEGTAVY